MAADHLEAGSGTALRCHRIWGMQILQYSKWPTVGFSIPEKSRSTSRIAPAQRTEKMFTSHSPLISMEHFFTLFGFGLFGCGGFFGCLGFFC